MADNLLDKASILLTPTAYNNGRMLSVKPNENLYGSELVTNGDFATDSNWNKDDSWTISGGTANYNYISGRNMNSSSAALVVGKTYKLVYTILNYSSGYVINDSAETRPQRNSNGTYTEVFTARYTFFRLRGSVGGEFSIDNVSVVEDLSGDFTFSRAGNASRVNSSGNIVTESTNIPRIDYTDGCGSWLLEPQSTNLYLNSDTLVTQSNATSASTYTVSFYGTGTITFSGTHTGTLVGTGANDRVSATFTATAGTLTSTVSGTCEKGQLENLSYATSYIPTNGATNTRLQDIATNSGNSTLINSTEGVLYAEIAALANTNSYRLIDISDGGSINRIYLAYTNADNKIRVVVRVSNSDQFDYQYTLTDATEFNKIAFKYKENDFALWVNGTEVYTDSSGITFPSNTLNVINFSNTFGTENFFVKAKAVAVFPILTNAQLQSLTTQ